MAHYFVSDVHLRLDHPERGRRFVEFVSRLKSDDSLMIVGDLCDFWMGTRNSESEILACDGIQILDQFIKRGGSLSIMAGNHDLWLTSFYERALGARIVNEPLDLVVDGIRIRLVHGHLLGARARWKAILESYAFFRGFELLPSPMAIRLDRILAKKNSKGLLADEERHLAVFRNYSKALENEADLVIFGHVHRPVNETECRPRLVVLGGWQRGWSCLKIESGGIDVIVHRDPLTADSDSRASSAIL